MFRARPFNLFKAVSLLPRWRNLSTIKGKATKEGTLAFVSQSQLKLYHQFSQSGLYINPVIHGAPRTHIDEDEDLENAAVALLQNRSNCLVVYEHNTYTGKPWALKHLEEILLPEESGVSRENVVTIANLGHADTALELYRRLGDARKRTGLEYIDMALFEVS